MVDTYLIPLAFAIKNNPNGYVAIVGAGLSSASGLPRADQIVEDLAAKVASLEGADTGGDATRWYEETHGSVTYESILERLAPASGDRQAILSGYLGRDPNQPDERQPNAGHRALATFAVKGYMRVFVTTNFDLLLEDALGDAGLNVASVSTYDDVLNLPPVDTLDALVFHVHGDYLKPETMRNTEYELSGYPEWSERFLASLLEGRGYVIVGWSGNYDPALRAAIKSSARGRYSTFWFERSQLRDDGLRLFLDLPTPVLLQGDAGEMLSSAAQGVDLLRASSGPSRDSAIDVRIAKQDLTAGSRPAKALESLERTIDEVLALPSMTVNSFDGSGYFGARMSEILSACRDLCGLSMVLGAHQETVDDVIDVVRFLGQPVFVGGSTALIAQRQLPGVLALAAAGVGATSARNWPAVGAFLTDCYVPTVRGNPGDDAPLALTFADEMFGSRFGATLLREFLATVVLDTAVMSSARFEEAWERWHLLWIQAALDYDHGHQIFAVPSLTVAGWRDHYSPLQEQWLERLKGRRVPQLEFLSRPTDFQERFRKQADDAAWSTLQGQAGALPSGLFRLDKTGNCAVPEDIRRQWSHWF